MKEPADIIRRRGRARENSVSSFAENTPWLIKYDWENENTWMENGERKMKRRI